MQNVNLSSAKIAGACNYLKSVRRLLWRSYCNRLLFDIFPMLEEDTLSLLKS